MELGWQGEDAKVHSTYEGDSGEGRAADWRAYWPDPAIAISSSWWQTDGFEALQHEGIQTHHICDTGHWVTLSSIAQSILVGCLSSSLTHQLALIFRLLVKTEDEDGWENGLLSTLFKDVPYAQQQNNRSDCGLFAIAFAVHLAIGDDVVGLNSDQSKMRQHMLKGKQCTDQGWPPLPHGDWTVLHLSDARNIWWYGWVCHVGTGTTSSVWV